MKESEELPIVEQYLDQQMDLVTDAQFENCYSNLFGSDAACRPMILALSELCELAQENEDKEMADACQLVMRGVALGRLGYLERPTV